MHDVRIEVLLLSISADAQLRWRVVTGDLQTGYHPDARVRELAGVGSSPPPTLVVHSTSWRQTKDALVLTYVVLPDPDPAAGTTQAVPPECHIASSGDAAAPTPRLVDLEHVLAHALRHLSLVARTTPELNTAVATDNELWHAVMKRRPDVAGQLAS